MSTAYSSRSGTTGDLPAYQTPAPLSAKLLPAWPALLPFAAYALWWILGIGDFIWIIAGFAIVASWIGVRDMRLATPMIIWVLFLLWVVASIAMNDTTGRVLGAVYRLLLYGAAGAFAIHIYNARHTITITHATRAMLWFLAGMTVCGYLALAAPELTIRTPMAYLMPGGLLNNELIRDMVIRNTTQWNPQAWIAQDVRPVAPFLYANTWGNVYSLVLPLVILHLWLVRTFSREFWFALVVIVASAPVALATLNRGMFIGLAAVLFWVAFQALRRGAYGSVLGGLGLMGVVGALWWVSPWSSGLFNRVSETESTEDRGTLYQDTYAGALQSPLFGYGSPRPGEAPWLPSLGTQGQLWTVMYSHGFVGLALFMGFLLVIFAILWRRTDPVGALLGGLILATVVETIFYGMMTGIFVTMLAVGLALRTDAGARGPETHAAVSSVDR